MDKLILNTIVRKTPTGYGVMVEEIDGFVLATKSIKKLENELIESIDFHIEGFEVKEPWMNDYLSGNYDFRFSYDLDSAIDKYDSIFGKGVFARIAGVNESLLRQYATGKKKPSHDQIKKIEENIHLFSQELSGLSLV